MLVEVSTTAAECSQSEGIASGEEGRAQAGQGFSLFFVQKKTKDLKKPVSSTFAQSS